jgi:two-component system LytT family sensor kinase
VELHQDPALDREAVPFLILPPLVENAIRHGIARQAGAGRLRIAARRNGDFLLLEVCDNGPGLADNGDRDLRDGVGLPHVRSRLRELYGERSGFSLESAPGGGAVATVKVPLSLR